MNMGKMCYMVLEGVLLINSYRVTSLHSLKPSSSKCFVREESRCSNRHQHLAGAWKGAMNGEELGYRSNPPRF